MSNTARPLRVAIVIDDFYPASGGVSRSVQTQIHELIRLGHHVTLLTPKHYLEMPDGCTTIPIPSFYLPGTPSYMCILRYSRRLAKKISKDHRFDIVHSQTERGALMLSARLAKQQNIPHLHSFHANLAGTHETNPIASFWGSMAYFLLINPAIAMSSRKRISAPVILPGKNQDAPSFFARFDWHSLATVASRVDAYTTPAKFMARRINECARGLEERSHIVSTGVNPFFTSAINRQRNSQADSSSQLRLLSVCRLSKEKRVDAIVEAFIDADIKNSRLDIVGSGDQSSYIEKLVAGHPNIHLHHHLSSMDELAKLYLQANAFILASYRFDTQAVTLSEAAVAGLPIIYCDPRLDVGVSQQNSILTSSPSARDITRAIAKLSDTKQRQKMAEASEDIATCLTPEPMARQYVEIYRQLINQSKG